MRCPQCSAEQPQGVTVCGFCGAIMTTGLSPYRPPDEARSAAARRRARRWPLLLAAALVLGLAVGWAASRLDRDPVAATALAAERDGGGDESAPALEAAVAGEPRIASGGDAGRMTEARLTAIAERLARLAEEGEVRELAALVDVRARYRLTMEDPGGRRELDAGKPELLAHWLAPWLASERTAAPVDQLVEIQSVRVDGDPRQGWIVRRVETGGDATAVDYPRELLATLAMRGALSPRAVDALDLAPLVESLDRCVATETLRVVAAPLGVRVVEAERIGTCRP